MSSPARKRRDLHRRRLLQQQPGAEPLQEPESTREPLSRSDLQAVAQAIRAGSIPTENRPGIVKQISTVLDHPNHRYRLRAARTIVEAVVADGSDRDEWQKLTGIPVKELEGFPAGE